MAMLVVVLAMMSFKRGPEEGGQAEDEEGDADPEEAAHAGEFGGGFAGGVFLGGAEGGGGAGFFAVGDKGIFDFRFWIFDWGEGRRSGREGVGAGFDGFLGLGGGLGGVVALGEGLGDGAGGVAGDGGLAAVQRVEGAAGQERAEGEDRNPQGDDDDRTGAAAGRALPIWPGLACRTGVEGAQVFVGPLLTRVEVGFDFVLFAELVVAVASVIHIRTFLFWAGVHHGPLKRGGVQI